MIANVFFNAEMKWDGYEDGDVLTPSMLNPIVIPGHGREDLARLFAYLNHDERPNGMHERSFSVGDVVEVQVPRRGFRLRPPRTVRYACDPTGWRVL